MFSEAKARTPRQLERTSQDIGAWSTWAKEQIDDREATIRLLAKKCAGFKLSEHEEQIVDEWIEEVGGIQPIAEQEEHSE